MEGTTMIDDVLPIIALAISVVALASAVVSARRAGRAAREAEASLAEIRGVKRREGGPPTA
jgi:hypothetical protein